MGESTTDAAGGLRRELGFRDVYALSTGATLSAGFFLLPGLAAAEIGPALVLAYLLAALPMLPAMCSVLELATALPRAGGVYFYLDRALGPLVGTVGGLGTWLIMVLKVSFSLLGMGAYLTLVFGELPLRAVAVALALLLGVINALGARRSGGVQVLMVAGLLGLLGALLIGALPRLDPEPLRAAVDVGFGPLVATAGMVYVSYIGITKVASVAEEVRDPERVLPRAVLLSLSTVVLVYGLGTAVMVGVVPMDRLVGDLTPAATAAERLFGTWGRYLIVVAALLAFTSVANAGTLSASRYPLAMSRDRLVPAALASLGRWGTPIWGILLTVVAVVASILFLDVARIARLAGAFQLSVFILLHLCVLVLRRSRLSGYDPTFRSPLYPWMQLMGMVVSAVLIARLGTAAMLFSGALVAIGGLWFAVYGRRRAARRGALAQLFGGSPDRALERELEQLLAEREHRRLGSSRL